MSGTVKGLRARGGFEVDVTWIDGELASATVRSVAGPGGGVVRYGEKIVALGLKPGAVTILGPNLCRVRRRRIWVERYQKSRRRFRNHKYLHAEPQLA